VSTDNQRLGFALHDQWPGQFQSGIKGTSLNVVTAAVVASLVKAIVCTEHYPNLNRGPATLVARPSNKFCTLTRAGQGQPARQRSNHITLSSYPQSVRTVIGTLQQEPSFLYARAVPLPFPLRRGRVIWGT
jgi:hypothetical protein